MMISKKNILKEIRYIQGDIKERLELGLERSDLDYHIGKLTSFVFMMNGLVSWSVARSEVDRLLDQMESEVDGDVSS